MAANSGSGNVWAFNPLLLLNSGACTVGGAQVAEFDLANNSGTHFGDTAGPSGVVQPAVFGMQITGVSTHRSTAAGIVLGNLGDGSPMWNHGWVFANNSCVKDIIADYGTSTNSIDLQGTHTGYAIDTAVGTFTKGALRVANQGKIVGRNAGNSADYTLMRTSVGNSLYLAEYGMPYVITDSQYGIAPSVDNVQVCGVGGARWTSVHTVNATVDGTAYVANLNVTTSMYGAGVSALFASPPTIGWTVAGSARFTTLATINDLTVGANVTLINQATVYYRNSVNTTWLPMIASTSVDSVVVGGASAPYVLVSSANGLAPVNNGVQNLGVPGAYWASLYSVNATVSGTSALSIVTVSTSLSGAGVNALFASPPVIGGTAPNSAAFTSGIFNSSGSYGVTIGATPTYGLDLVNCAPSTAAIRVYNQHKIVSRNAANSGEYRMIQASSGDSIVVAQSTCPYVLIDAGTGLAPSNDNVQVCGQNGARWASVWAANGTIQTSDPSLKTDITDLPSSLALVMAIHPATYRWIEGGKTKVPVSKTRKVQATKKEDYFDREIQLRNGKPVMVQVAKTRDVLVWEEMQVEDEEGNLMYEDAEQTLPLMGQVPVIIDEEYFEDEYIPQEGKRTHWGFLADNVQEVMARTGRDFGGFVLGEDGIKHLRYDQLLPVLWKAFQELSEEFEDLRSQLRTVNTP